MPDDVRASLVRYDAALQALAEAVRIDDVKQIRDVAVAAQAYARQAQDFEMLNSATDIKEQAERRAGEKLIELLERGEREGQGGDRRSKSRRQTLKLDDLRITKRQSRDWQRKAKMTPDAFARHVEGVKRRIGAATRTSTAEKRDRRAERERELAIKQAAMPKQQFGVIYADPPWRFEPYSRDTGMDRAADNHYPTMTLAEIKAMQIPAAEDAVLFLWATVPMLLEALDVMAAWGFAYKSHFVWVKNRAGTGYWNRNRHELLLIGTRGDIPAPAPGQQYSSVIDASVGTHSAKPFHFVEIIEDLFPTLPRIELFARETRLGWEAWGNEVAA
jgi:N6-adenosine-specific RNA methylase IME4